MLPAAFFSRLAEIPITGDQVQILIIALICAVIVGGIGSIKAVLDIVRFFRGDPPSDQKFASKADMAAALVATEAMERRINDDLTELKAAARTERVEFRSTLKEMFDRMDSMNRSLGRIEGQLQGRPLQN